MPSFSLMPANAASRLWMGKLASCPDRQCVGALDEVREPSAKATPTWRPLEAMQRRPVEWVDQATPQRRSEQRRLRHGVGVSSWH